MNKTITGLLITFLLFASCVARSNEVIDVKVNHDYATVINVINSQGKLIPIFFNRGETPTGFKATLLDRKTFLAVSVEENQINSALLKFSDGKYKYKIKMIPVAGKPDLKVVITQYKNNQ